MRTADLMRLGGRASGRFSLRLMLMSAVAWCAGCENPALCELVEEAMWCGGEIPRVVAGEQPQPEVFGCACGDLHVPQDNVVDELDFAAFQACLDPSAPNAACPGEIWTCADLNQDGAVDQVDFITFEVLFNLSPDGEVPPECLNVE